MRNVHDQLDDFKLLIAKAVLRESSLSIIRVRSLSNLDRWNAKGTWCSAHDEWRRVMGSGTDEEIIALMTGTDQNANRLRQSAPYVGIINPETRRACLQEAGLTPASMATVAKVQALIDSGEL